MGTVAIVGTTIGVVGFLFGMTTFVRLNRLEQHLKQKGILDKEYSSH
ncbi:hypothetical protein JQC92_06665 [Shewanella sp. 202IG2-18]|nr:hypothetical protein [Parashewanella hymeniacidonis]MBM7071724.1 hypothetical protein [Parashewanella hymeniacidonis]